MILTIEIITSQQKAQTMNSIKNIKTRGVFAIISLMILIMISCRTDPKKSVINITESEISGLATPVKLNYDTTIIFLKDYLSNPDAIKELIFPAGLRSLKKEISDTTILISDTLLAKYSILTVVTKSSRYDIPVLKSDKQKYTFTFNDPKRKYKTVAIKGEMNAWNPANTPLKYENGNWSAAMYLEPDNYQYQIVLDGNSVLDPQNKDKISNGIGGWNSVLLIKNTKSDKKPYLFTDRTSGDSIFLKLSDTLSEMIVLYQNHKIDFISIKDGILILIPKEAGKVKRSYIRARAFNSSYVSDEVYIPLEYGKVLTEPGQLTRQDKETNIMYFLMVDRFKDGNKENNMPLNDPEVSPKADFKGGDLKGVTEMLNNGFFEKLGVNCIWLSPIVENPKGKYGFYNKGGVKSKFSAYHGYWPVSFTKVDERFGTAQDLTELVNAAHKKNNNIILDIVAHHVHEQHPVFVANKHKKWTTDLYLPDGTLNTEKWDEHRLTTWFDVFLPTLNLELNEVSQMLSDSTVFWLDKYNVDGFRHDATKHIPVSFWRMLTEKVKETSTRTGKSYYQVGETYGTPELIDSYIGSGLLDAQFDFNLFDAMLNSVVKDDVGFETFADRVRQSIKYYGVRNLMANITGNQDKPRFMALATGDVRFDEDAKLAGWTRNIEKKTEEGYKKLALMHSLIMTLPGIPVIYYGDEIGMTGGNDPDNRRMMKFDGFDINESKLFSAVSGLTKLRKNNPVFLFGDLNFLKAEKDILVYSRKYFNKTAIVIVNSNKTNSKIRFNFENNKGLKPLFNSSARISGKEIEINMNPLSYEVLMN